MSKFYIISLSWDLYIHEQYNFISTFQFLLTVIIFYVMSCKWKW